MFEKISKQYSRTSTLDMRADFIQWVDAEWKEGV